MWSVARCPSVQITWGCPPGDGQSGLWRTGKQSALKLWLKRKLHLFVSSSAGEMLSIPLPLIFKLFAWKAPSVRFQLWRLPCITSSEELPLLGVQVQRPAKRALPLAFGTAHTPWLEGTERKGQPHFNNTTICRRSLSAPLAFPSSCQTSFPSSRRGTKVLTSNRVKLLQGMPSIFLGLFNIHSNAFYYSVNKLSTDAAHSHRFFFRDYFSAAGARF